MGEVGCAGRTVSGRGGGNPEGAAYETQMRPSPDGSHLGGPLRGVLHHRLAEAVIHVGSHLNPRAGPEPLRTLVGLLPAQRSGCLRPARSTRLPARLGLISQTAAAAAAELAGPVRGQLGGARSSGARDRRAGSLGGERGRARGAGGTQLRRPAAPRVPAARSADGHSPSSSSSSSPLGRARLPGAPGSLPALA